VHFHIYANSYIWFYLITFIFMRILIFDSTWLLDKTEGEFCMKMMGDLSTSLIYIWEFHLIFMGISIIFVVYSLFLIFILIWFHCFFCFFFYTFFSFWPLISKMGVIWNFRRILDSIFYSDAMICYPYGIYVHVCVYFMINVFFV